MIQAEEQQVNGGASRGIIGSRLEN